VSELPKQHIVQAFNGGVESYCRALEEVAGDDDVFRTELSTNSQPGWEARAKCKEMEI